MTLEQRRSETAWRFAREGVAVSDQYKDLAKATPALIMNNGLMQTLAFFEDKGKDHHKTLASHLRRWDVDGSSGYETIRSFQPDGTIGFKQFDLSLARTWDTGSDVKLKVRADVLNVFDWQNWGGYGINWRSGEINRWDQYATRTFKLSFGLDW